MTDRNVTVRIKGLIITMAMIAALCLSLSACQSSQSQNKAAATDDNTAQYLEELETSGDIYGQSEDEEIMQDYDFSIFTNVEITGVDISTLNWEELSVLYRQAEYCQAMTDADINKMREIVSKDMTFTHMSGMTQSREEYFTDIEKGLLNYFIIGIENPNITVDGDIAEISFTSLLNANAYGARGTYRMTGTHRYERRDGEWIAVNR